MVSTAMICLFLSFLLVAASSGLEKVDLKNDGLNDLSLKQVATSGVQDRPKSLLGWLWDVNQQVQAPTWDNDQPGPVPWDNYEPGPVPWDNYQPGPVPWNNDKPSPVPWGNYQPGPLPWDNYKPVPVPWDNDQPGPVSWDNDKPSPEPWDNDKPGPVPWNNYQPGPLPWDNYKPVPVPSDNNQPGPVPWDNDQPTPVPWDNFLPSPVPWDNYQPGRVPWDDDHMGPFPSWDDDNMGPLPSWDDDHMGPLPSWDDDNMGPLPSWDDDHMGPLPSWDNDHMGPLPSWDDDHMGPLPSWDDDDEYPQPPWNENYPHPLAPWDYNQSPLPAWDDNQQDQLRPWNVNQLSPRISRVGVWQPGNMWPNDNTDDFPPRVDRRPPVYYNSLKSLKENLLAWDRVERHYQDLLARAQQNLNPQVDHSARSVGVMFATSKLALNLAQNCSPLQYVKTYRRTVSTQLVRAHRTPQVAIKHVSNVLNTIRKNTKQVRALVFGNQCENCGWQNPPLSSTRQLQREKNLAVALGRLARTVMSSYALLKTVRDDRVIPYMLNDQQAQARMYPLTVKTARVYQLLSNKKTCELQTRVPWLTENTNDDSDESNDGGSYEVVVS